jgi:hypothetical protein
MIYFAVAVSLGLFVWGLKRSRVIDASASAIGVARRATAMLLDRTVSDAEKERAARAAATRLLRHAGAILARFALAVVAPLAFLALLIALRLIGVASVLRVLESWEFIAASSCVVAAVPLWRR